MQVKAKPGEKCPLEGKPRQYITDGVAVTVPETSYYRRLVREGSLLEVKAPVEKKAEKTAAKGGDK